MAIELDKKAFVEPGNFSKERQLAIRWSMAIEQSWWMMPAEAFRWTTSITRVTV